MYFKMTNQTVEQHVEDTGYKKQSSKEKTEDLKNKAGVSKKTSRRKQ